MNFVVISQPRYLPSITYLQRLKNADVFVFLDNVQRQSRGWENRNKILNKGSPCWVTIPVASSNRIVIDKAVVDSIEWVDKHKNIIRHAYAAAPFFQEYILDKYYQGVKDILVDSGFSYRDVIIHLLRNVCDLFGFSPNVKLASRLVENKLKGNDNLLNIVKSVDGNIYVSGMNGRNYGVKEVFEEFGINVMFHDPEEFIYQQFNSNIFISGLCFFDMLFNVGIEKTQESIFSWNLKEN